MTRNSETMQNSDFTDKRPDILLSDYLVDVSAIAAAMKPYGENPLNYLLQLLSPQEISLPILLGNAANQFMDDCVNTPPAQRSFRTSMQRHFHQSILDYTFAPVPPEHIFFEEAHRQMHHISSSLDQGLVPLGDVLLEPLFLCPALGLRGRFDVMTADHRNVVELKSGKADDWKKHTPEAKTEHLVQMLLYREILHYNIDIPREDIRLKLFYSRYPYVIEGQDNPQLVARALHLRNGIVALLQKVSREGVWAQLKGLTADSLNENGLQGKLWDSYLRPPIERQLATWHNMPDNEREYLDAFLTFLFAEHLRLATTYDRNGEHRGFARTWQAAPEEKKANGRMLSGLRLTGSGGDGGTDRLAFSRPLSADNSAADFNRGDMVLLYENKDENDDITRRQVTRAYIEEIDETSLSLRLAYRQRNLHFFPAETRYTIESDYSSLSFTAGVRSLMSLTEMPVRTKSLLLGAGDTRPTTDESLSLSVEAPETVAAQVLAAKRAKDFFLLIGPPGSGKTSIAMRTMTADFLASRAEGEHLLLTAYTNRAVDEICQMLDTLPGADYVRIGNDRACAPAYRQHMLSVRTGEMERRDEVKALFDRTPIVVGTVLSLSPRTALLRYLRPSCMIVDEASQVLEPILLSLLTHTRKFVLIGDHRQLPAVVALPPTETETTAAGLHCMELRDRRQSLFQRLHRLAETRGWKGVCASLEVQGRMHAEICDFVSQTFYAGRLRTAGLPHQTEILPVRRYTDAVTTFVANYRMGFVNVPGPKNESFCKSSEEEAQWIVRIAKALANWHEAEGRLFDAAAQIGIIVPFRNQIAAIRNQLKQPDIIVDTVECFQGSQRDFILFSTVVHDSASLRILSQEEIIGGQSVDRKLNVAVSRARRAFFLVGDAATLGQSPSYAALLGRMKRFDEATIQASVLEEDHRNDSNSTEECPSPAVS